MDDEVNRMAIALRAYWRIAAERFIDSHIMSVDCEMIAVLPDKIRERLESLLSDVPNNPESDAVNGICWLLQEGEGTARTRITLTDRRDRLASAKRTVNLFGHYAN